MSTKKKPTLTEQVKLLDEEVQRLNRRIDYIYKVLDNYVRKSAVDYYGSVASGHSLRKLNDKVSKLNKRWERVFKVLAVAKTAAIVLAIASAGTGLGYMLSSMWFCQ